MRDEWRQEAEAFLEKHKNGPSITAKDFEMMLKGLYRKVMICDESRAQNAMVNILDRDSNINGERMFRKGYVHGWNNAVEDVSCDIPDPIGENSISQRQNKYISTAFHDTLKEFVERQQ